MNYIRLTVLLLLLFLTMGCARDDRAQAAANARVGLMALAAAYQAGIGTAEALAIIKGIDKYLPAAAGVNSAEWPAPQHTVEQIQKKPTAYGDAAPPEPEMFSLATKLTGLAIFLLGVIRVAAPIIPGAGPLVQGVANLAWSLMASRQQKRADQVAETIGQAAQTAKPVLDALRALPLKDMPPSIADAIRSPIVSMAIDHLATTPERAKNG
jgi:hypothetical protein